jgi:hypothetical protein
VSESIAQQIEAADPRIGGIMLGKSPARRAAGPVAGMPLVYGQSITDSCIDWQTSVSFWNVSPALSKSGARAIAQPCRPAEAGSIEGPMAAFNSDLLTIQVDLVKRFPRDLSGFSECSQKKIQPP